MPSLKILNLKGNNLSHQIPAELIEKQHKGSLLLSLDGDPTSSQKNIKNIVVPIVSAVGGVIVLLIGIYFVINRKKQRTKQDEGSKILESKRRHYSYLDILRITNNFERLLGKGGFGNVYYGIIDNIEVAVKMLSTTSVQGYQQFQAEVDLLLVVHHKNLISFIGYCKDNEYIGLIYEYMEKGNLRSLLLDRGGEVLSWNQRLQIALDAAQGLEYLHNGCKPPIIHRDIKTTNILLNKSYQAKLADFGLSKLFHVEGSINHISTTNVVGTLGYLDPEYLKSFRLTEKSDIYSFGVVLLEIVTGKPAYSGREEPNYIIRWANHMINNGDINSIIDPKLRKDYDSNSAWKIVEIAMSCVFEDSMKRPPMIHIVNELRECLNNIKMNQIELEKQNNSATDSSTGFDSFSYPGAR